MAQLTEEKLAHIADQSRLYIADDEVASLLDDLNDTISYTEKITKIDTDHVKATTNGNQLTNVLREDIPVKWEERDAALEHAPEHDGAHFKVPTIMD
ncbi:MAG TPA: Asp-tRNA(Asn)/Glu-tRNA(Gln) amidotransferase subunit GatC [Pseudogracilibacillus sp.]|nr:Asp-tRNA(Asn)/Glu-tRNA(Gln) amidotransferase subunit GatC [Pseudogracilibacillus sp.]